MTENQKMQVAERLRLYCERYESQNKAANSLRGVSAATISAMLNNKWELIKAEMWMNVAAQIGYRMTTWVPIETRDFQIITRLLIDARENSNVFAICGDAGTGKSLAFRTFRDSNARVYLLQCNEFWNRKTFLQELLQEMGRDYAGYTVGEMMHEVVRILKTTQNPLIIMDEADKLSDQVLYFFITLYNRLEEHCGIVLAATDHLSKKVMKGLKHNRKGYKEIYSRVGRRFIELKGPSSKDIMAICNANGVTDREEMKKVIDECEGDLRRVRRMVHALRMQHEATEKEPVTQN
jgi:DNA transposition AAA+ family ATPase